MAYTTPATFTAGNILTASQLNTNLRDNVAWLATDSPSCRGYRSTTQTISTATTTDILFDAERYDNASMHSTSVNTGRFTIPSGGAGKYLFVGTVGLAASGTGTDRQAYFLQNATTVLARNRMHVSATVQCAGALVTAYAMVATDYVTMQIFQDSGGNLAASGDPAGGPECAVFWFRT